MFKSESAPSEPSAESVVSPIEGGVKLVFSPEEGDALASVLSSWQGQVAGLLEILDKHVESDTPIDITVSAIFLEVIKPMLFGYVASLEKVITAAGSPATLADAGLFFEKTEGQVPFMKQLVVILEKLGDVENAQKVKKLIMLFQEKESSLAAVVAVNPGAL